MNAHRPPLDQLIQALGLRELPQEGGLYAETYRSPEILPAGALGQSRPPHDKPCGSAIFYLLTGQPGSFSALHRLPSDEIWHFYLGDPLEMTLLYPDGAIRQVMLGPDILNGQQVQFVAPAGVWQGTRLLPQGGDRPGERYALVGTTMAPGFTPDDYEHGQRAALREQYPAAAEWIDILTRE